MCAGDGHTEALKVEFDPSRTSYEAVMNEFWKEANPCEKGSKPQYKTAIWTSTDSQRKTIEKQIENLKTQGKRVTIDVLPAKKWHDAEEYHQRYIQKGGNGGCNIM